MRFCPACGNLLLTETLSVHDDGEPYYTRYCCATCPYKHEMKRAFTNTIRTKKKQKDDVFGGDDAWENVDRTSKCLFGECGDETRVGQLQLIDTNLPSLLLFSPFSLSYLLSFPVNSCQMPRLSQ